MTAYVHGSIETQPAEEMLALLDSYLQPDKLDVIMDAVAQKAMVLLQQGTPRKNDTRWGTGNLRKAWEWKRINPGERYVVNQTTVRTSRGTIFLLDLLASGHPAPVEPINGPVLFIALTARARREGWSKNLKRGEDYVIVQRTRKDFVASKATKPVETMTPRIRKMFNKAILDYLAKFAGAKFN